MFKHTFGALINRKITVQSCLVVYLLCDVTPRVQTKARDLAGKFFTVLFVFVGGCQRRCEQAGGGGEVRWVHVAGGWVRRGTGGRGRGPGGRPAVHRHRRHPLPQRQWVHLPQDRQGCRYLTFTLYNSLSWWNPPPTPAPINGRRG